MVDERGDWCEDSRNKGRIPVKHNWERGEEPQRCQLRPAGMYVCMSDAFPGLGWNGMMRVVMEAASGGWRSRASRRIGWCRGWLRLVLIGGKRWAASECAGRRASGGGVERAKKARSSFGNGCGFSGVALWQCVAATDGDDASGVVKTTSPWALCKKPGWRSAKSALTPPAQ